MTVLQLGISGELHSRYKLLLKTAENPLPTLELKLMAGVCSPAGPAPLLDQICATMSRGQTQTPVELWSRTLDTQPPQPGPRARPPCCLLILLLPWCRLGPRQAPRACYSVSGAPLPPAHLTSSPAWVRTHCGPSSQPESPPIAPPSLEEATQLMTAQETLSTLLPDSEKGNQAPKATHCPTGPGCPSDSSATTSPGPLVAEPRLPCEQQHWFCTAPSLQEPPRLLLSSERADPLRDRSRRSS